MANKPVVTRFAPSPTGFLHVGSLRTALYVFLYARHNKGRFLLRIEDTDQTRKVEGAVENLLAVLKIFGLKWDNEKPMIQSERIGIHQKYAKALVESGHAYYCFCSTERLEQVKSLQLQKKLPPMYDGKCRDLPKEEVQNLLAEGAPYVIRFKMPKTGISEFTDLIRGKVSIANNILDDQIILKSDGFPTYHLAAVVDDHDQGVTHVIRGEEWLPSTPKHILLHQALGFEPPEFAHLPLLLNADRSKLSKRQGDVACEDYLKQGYLPETLLNFVLLLGWNPGTDQEIFSLEEMIKIFSLEKINKAGAIFDTKKLDWLNGLYLRQKTAKDLAQLAKPFFDQAGIVTEIDYLAKVVATEQTRIKKLSELVENTGYFFNEPDYDPKILIWKKGTAEGARENLTKLNLFLNSIEDKDWQTEILENKVLAWIKEQGLGNGDVLWPARVALSGKEASPGPFEIALVLGKEKTLKRINKATSKL